jgi:hypothetical protein
VDEDPTWKRFRLERLQNRLREMQANGNFGDERQQKLLLTEIQQLKSSLGLRILPEDHQVVAPPQEADAPKPVHPKLSTRRSHNLLPFAAAVTVAGVALATVIRTWKHAKVPIALER